MIPPLSPPGGSRSEVHVRLVDGRWLVVDGAGRVIASRPYESRVYRREGGQT